MLASMSDTSGGGLTTGTTTSGGKVKKPRKRYDILKTASCTVCGKSLLVKNTFLREGWLRHIG